MEAVAREDRLNAAVLFALASGWLIYTRLYAAGSALHGVLPPCPFLFLTGHPCPLCGATRGYAAVWRGDFGSALRFHPLAPLFFAATAAAAAGLGLVALTGRRPARRLPARQQAAIFAAGLAVVTAAWVFRLLFLPLPS